MGIRRRGKRWTAAAYNPQTKQNVYIGTYATREEAAVAFQAARVPRGSGRPFPKVVRLRPTKPWNDIPRDGRLRVYVFAADEVGRIKIGITNNLVDRIQDLNSSSPVAITYVTSFPGDLMDERAIHQKFARYRVRGEWFTRSPEIEHWIGTLLLPEELAA